MTYARRIQLILSLIILLLSLTLLFWGLLPSVRERRIQQLPPGEIQIPTPVSMLPEPVAWSVVLAPVC